MSGIWWVPAGVVDPERPTLAAIRQGVRLDAYVASADDGRYDHCSCHGYRRTTGACRQATEEQVGVVMRPMTWRLDLPYVKPLNLNDNLRGGLGAMHARRKEIKRWRLDVHTLALAAGIPPLARFTVEYHYRPKVNRIRDTHNLGRGLKPLVDGLVDAGVAPGDDPRYYVGTEPTIHPAERGQPARLWLIVRDLGPQPGSAE